MGARKAGIGESKATRYKEEFFGLCLGYHMKREARFLSQLSMPRPFFHLDLNAGAGYNSISRTVGTPILFLRQAVKHPDIDIEARFVESNPDTVETLRDRIRRDFSPHITNGSLFTVNRNFSVVRGDNEHVLLSYVQSVTDIDRPQFARGSIICDPNGWSRHGGSVSLDALAHVCSALPQFLVLIFFPYALAKMVTGWAENAPGRKATLRKVSDFLQLRPHWLISEPRGGNLFLCGTATRFPGGTDFVPAYQHTSAMGQSIIADCDTIKDRSKAIAGRERATASAC